MIWLLAILAVLILLPCVPVFLTVRGTREWKARVWVLGIPFTLVDSARPEKPARAAKAEKVPEKPAKKEKSSFLGDLGRRWKEEGPVAVWEYLGSLGRLLAGTALRLLRAVTADRLSVRLFVVGEDASETALRFGKVCAVFYPSVRLFSSLLRRVWKQQCEVSPDFLAEETHADMRLVFHVVPWRVIGILLLAAGRFLWIQTHHQLMKGQR